MNDRRAAMDLQSAREHERQRPGVRVRFAHSLVGMKKNVLSNQRVSLYRPLSGGPPEPGDLLRVRSGVVMRVVRADTANGVVRAKRRSGQLEELPIGEAQVFRRAEGELQRGSIVEWPDGYPDLELEPMQLARVMDLNPTRGIVITWSRKGQAQERHLSLDPGLWYCAITNGDAVAYRRDRGPLASEAFLDLKPKPPWLTHDDDIDSIARPFALRTIGGPPQLSALQRGNQLLVESAADDVPSGHLFVIAEVDTQRGRVHLVEGRELSARATRCEDRWYAPHGTDRVRLYQPATTIARSDLLRWKRPHPDLCVRRGNCGEVVEVMEDSIAVTGVTATPEVLSFDPRRWRPISSVAGALHLRRNGR